MTTLLIGLALFFSAHSVRIVADPWRTRVRERLGPLRWRGLYSLMSLAGLALMIWGYGVTRAAPELWSPPAWTRHLAALLTLPAFVLVAAAYVPGNRLKAAVGNPMVAGVALWALAHLPANGRPGDLLLFGAFLLWAVLDFISATRRDRAAGTIHPPGTLAGDARLLVIGLAAWLLFAFYGHAWLIGVRPM
jgi:uncharacterized membrane protein